MRPEKPRSLAGLGSQTAALCDITRQVLRRFDLLIEAMGGSQRSISTGVLAPRLNDRADVVLINALAKLTELFRLSLATIPVTHEVVEVLESSSGITEIIRNSTERVVPMMITNNDTSQFLKYGAETLTHLNGAMLMSEKSIIVNVMPSSAVYAVFPLYTASVSISRLGIP